MSAKTKSRFSRFDVADHIKTAADAEHYLNAVLEDGDVSEIADALGAIARSHGMREISEKTGFSRETLYRTLSADGNPTLTTLQGVLKAMGLRLTVTATKTR